MKKHLTMSLAAALLVGMGNAAYGYDEGGTSPNTVKFGYEAGTNNTSLGFSNTFLGYRGGYNNTKGVGNVFIGHESGYNNIDGHDNIFIGYHSGYDNTDGYGNIFIGSISGAKNTSGYRNTFIGEESGTHNTTGMDNIFIGNDSGYSNTSGGRNVAIGWRALYYNETKGQNVAVGWDAGRECRSNYNVFIGDEAGQKTQNGDRNVIIGDNAGSSNISGKNNTMVGRNSGNKSYGDDNVFVGLQSGMNNEDGDYNTYLGAFSGANNRDGIFNTFVGDQSGYNADVNRSVFLGYGAGYNATRNNTLYIANSITDHPLIYGEFDTGVVKINGDLNTTGPVTASFSGYTAKQALKMMDIRVNNTNDDKKSDVGFQMTNVREDFSWSFRTWEPDKGLAIAKVGNGATKELRLYDTDPTDPTSVVLSLANGAYCDGVWHDTSSRSMKCDIKDLDAKEAMKAFTKLRPVIYAYKANPTDQKVGFIAEDVPDLVADPGRKSLSPMDMVALLTKVVQVQEKRMKTMRESFEKKLAAQEEKISKLEKIRKRLSRLEALLTNLALKPSAGKERLSSKRR